VLNVFMCSGFTRDTGQYFMKASPVRPGDYLEFFAGIDLLACLSACPGGDCSAEQSSDAAACHPLVVEIYKPERLPEGWLPPQVNGYDGSHGLQSRSAKGLLTATAPGNPRARRPRVAGKAAGFIRQGGRCAPGAPERPPNARLPRTLPRRQA
jgi:hypothetical protein